MILLWIHELRYERRFLGLTQSVERLPVEREVAGSISPDRINTQGLPLSHKSDQIQVSPYKIKT